MDIDATITLCCGGISLEKPRVMLGEYYTTNDSVILYDKEDVSETGSSLATTFAFPRE